MASADLLYWNTVSFYLDLGILVIMIYNTILIYLRYKERKQSLAHLVFLMFMSIDLALFFLWLSHATYYSLNVAAMNPQSFVGWIMFRVGYYRFSFAIVSLVGYYAYRLKEQIFDRDPSKKYLTFILLFAIINALYAILVFDPNQPAYDLIAFALSFIYVSIIFFQFLIKAYSLAKRIEEIQYRKGIQSLVYMSISFILFFILMLLDRIMVDAAGWYFSPFYFIGEVFLVLGTITAYLGYIKPGREQAKQQEL